LFQIFVLLVLTYTWEALSTFPSYRLSQMSDLSLSYTVANWILKCYRKCYGEIFGSLNVPPDNRSLMHDCKHAPESDSSGRKIGLSQKSLPNYTYHSQQRDIHASGGIRTRNPIKRADADLAATGIGKSSDRLSRNICTIIGSYGKT
jgi:hypothetical protein